MAEQNEYPTSTGRQTSHCRLPMSSDCPYQALAITAEVSEIE